MKSKTTAKQTIAIRVVRDGLNDVSQTRADSIKTLAAVQLSLRDLRAIELELLNDVVAERLAVKRVAS